MTHGPPPSISPPNGSSGCTVVVFGRALRHAVRAALPFGSAVIAFILHQWWTVLRQTPGAWARVAGVLCAALAFVHLVMAPVLRLALPGVLRNGLNVHEGQVTHRAVADALKLKYTPAEAALRL